MQTREASGWGAGGSGIVDGVIVRGADSDAARGLLLAALVIPWIAAVLHISNTYSSGALLDSIS